MGKLVQFGAGNIGRSFIGQLFAQAGYQVVFVEVNPVLVAALNQRRRYRVEIHDDPPGEILVQNVRAVDGRQVAAVAAEVASADIAATAVGPGALPQILPGLAAGLAARQGKPLDLIIAENLRGAPQLIREGMRRLLPADFPLEQRLGLVETSIGKMVPLIPEEVRQRDPLLVYAEAYNTLIVDAKGFLNPIPAVPGLEAQDNIAAYVDRKAFIHNLGHAAVAYAGWTLNPGLTYIWQAMKQGPVVALARRAMEASAEALMARYPGEFTWTMQQRHIADLLRRFANRALGDTVHRVGRDLPRKLGPQDRLVGALRLQQGHGADWRATCTVIALALRFCAPDEHGHVFPADGAFAAWLAEVGARQVLVETCGLAAADPALTVILAEYRRGRAVLAAQSEKP